MRATLLLAILILPLILFAQNLKLINHEGQPVEVALLDDSGRHRIIQELDGRVDESLRMERTARTYKLSDGRFLIEFFDAQGALVASGDLAKLRGIRFFKTHIDFLKRNITYRIDLPYAKGKELALAGKRLEQFKSSMPEFSDFALYELSTGQILYIAHDRRDTAAMILENLKAAADINEDVLTQLYGNPEIASAKFIGGDPMWDYDPQQFWVYPDDLKKVITNHRLRVVEQKVYLDVFYSNLFVSEHGYYIAITEFNQKDMSGVGGLGIGEAKVFKSLEEVKALQREYKKNKGKAWKSEHFYRNVSDKHGREFPARTGSLIDTMCKVLNIDRKILTFDANGMALVDEAIHWNHDKYILFDQWFPGALAFYGECYMRVKGDGKWVVRNHKSKGEADVLIPHLVLSDGGDAFDSNDFYKSLWEWPIALEVAGDWDGNLRSYKRR